MKLDNTSEHFKIWPFRAEARREDGEINNGGVDLIAHPEQIELIHEATLANGMRQVLKYLNRPNGQFRTLGCAAGLDEDGAYYSYLEFTLRDLAVARDESWPHDFERNWQDWASNVEEAIPGLGRALLGSSTMEYREFSYRESAPQLLITLYSQTQRESDHERYFSYVLRFFEEFEHAL